MGTGWAVRGGDASEPVRRGLRTGSQRGGRSSARSAPTDGVDGHDVDNVLDGPDADPLAMAREIALRALTARARTRSELVSILTRRNVPDDVVTELLGRLSDVKLIDDRDFAKSWVAGQQRRQKSSRVLKQELLGKGVDAELVDEALEGLDPACDERVASALVAKRLPSVRGLDRQAQYRRLTGLLARRGFSPAVIASVVKGALSGEPQDWE